MSEPNKSYTTSKHHNKLWFTDPAPGKTMYFEHPFANYALEGRILYNDTAETPWVYSIHGARADFSKSDSVSFGLQQRGYSILSMNMSGHSEAGILKPEETTLGDNVKEVASFYPYLHPKRKKIIIAYSLGGTPALKLLESHSEDIEKIVLFYPGIYTVDAYDKHFGQEFRETVSEPFSYRENDTIKLLRKFKGKLLLIKGQYDGLDPVEWGKPEGRSAGDVEVDGKTFYSPIPKEVIDMIYDSVPEDRKQFIEIPKCGHSVVLWMREHPREAKVFLDQIDRFLK